MEHLAGERFVVGGRRGWRVGDMTGEVGCRGRLVDKKGGRWRRSRVEGPWLLVFRRKRGESRGKEVGRSALLAFRDGGSVL